MQYGGQSAEAYGLRKFARQERVSLSSKIFFEDYVFTHLGAHDAIMSEVTFREIIEVEARVKRAWDMIFFFSGATIASVILCHTYIGNRGLAWAMMILLGAIGIGLTLSANQSANIVLKTQAGELVFDTAAANVNEVRNFVATLRLALISYREDAPPV